MRILVLNWRDPGNPLAGGAEQYLMEILKRLSGRHRIVLLTSRFPHSEPHVIQHGVEIHRVGSSLGLYVNAARWILQRKRNIRFDAVVESINTVPFFTRFYLDLPRVSILYHIAGSRVLFKELPAPLALVAHAIERSLPLICRGNPVVTISESTKTQLLRIGFDRGGMSVIRPGIVPPGNSEVPKTYHPQICYVGRIKKYKRLDHLLEAFSRVRVLLPECRLVIAGRGDYSQLKITVDSLGITDAVSLRGAVSEDEKYEILGSSWLFVSPSSREGWGISVVEANSVGTPAVGYNVEGLSDSIVQGVTGICVPDGNLELLTYAIYRVLSDTDLRNRMRRDAIDWSHFLSWEQAAGQFERVLLSCTRRP